MKKDPVIKICLAGLVLALVIIFTRFLSIQNIPVLPFVRISLGPALIIFASIALGPIFGGIVGGASDILGILLIPNALGYSINPWFTLIYTLLGILPWCFFKIFNIVKNEKMKFISFGVILFALWVFVLIYGLCNNSFGGHTFETYQKVLVFSISFALCFATLILIYFIGKHFKKTSDISVMNIAITSLVSEIFIMLIGNTIVKSIFFEVDFMVILFFQSVVFFIDIPLNTLVVSYLYKLINKVYLNKARL
ncbi:MAG: ECF transporter S component [Bacilli bacterium]|nr:ECF transporter S component [Bacilli bacterium]